MCQREHNRPPGGNRKNKSIFAITIVPSIHRMGSFQMQIHMMNPEGQVSKNPISSTFLVFCSMKVTFLTKAEDYKFEIFDILKNQEKMSYLCSENRNSNIKCSIEAE